MTKAAPSRADVDRESIVADPDFIARQYGLDSTHTRSLAQVVRNGDPLDRILLWRDPSRGANALTLLDGAYRLAAYRLAGWSGPVPALIVECTRKEALLRVAAANSKDRRGLSNNEKQDYAWKLTRVEGIAFSIAELARSTGVSRRNVVRMRNRWRELQGRSDATVTGRWLRDQKDEQEDWVGADDMSQTERSAAIREQAGKVRDLMDWRKGNPILSDGHAVFEVIEVAFGTPWAHAFAEWTLQGKAEAEDWMTGDTDDEDENPDF